MNKLRGEVRQPAVWTLDFRRSAASCWEDRQLTPGPSTTQTRPRSHRETPMLIRVKSSDHTCSLCPPYSLPDPSLLSFIQHTENKNCILKTREILPPCYFVQRKSLGLGVQLHWGTSIDRTKKNIKSMLQPAEYL